MNKSNKYLPEVKERAVQLVQEARKDYSSQRAAVESIAPKIGCAAVTQHEWVKKHEIDSGIRDGVPSAERERIKSLAREVKKLRQANDILRLSSAFFAQAEFDRHRDEFGVEPICKLLQIAPSGYWRYVARQRDPSLRSVRQCAGGNHQRSLQG